MSCSFDSAIMPSKFCKLIKKFELNEEKKKLTAILLNEFSIGLEYFAAVKSLERRLIVAATVRENARIRFQVDFLTTLYRVQPAHSYVFNTAEAESNQVENHFSVCTHWQKTLPVHKACQSAKVV